MRLAHVLVLMLSCGCSLETRPLSVGASRSVRAKEPEPALQRVSFQAWRNVDWRADAGGASAADGGSASTVQGSPDAALPEVQTGNRGLPARGSADNVRAQSGLRIQPEAGAAGQLEAAGAGAGHSGADAAAASTDMGDIDAGVVPPQMQGPAGAAAPPSMLPAGAGGDVSAAAGQGGSAADGGMDAAVPVDAAVLLVDAGSMPDASDRDGPYRELLERVLDTLERQRGGARTPEVRNLIANVRTLLELPESERTRSEMADVLVRLAGANVCRFDNPSDCAALCNALERDCSVCRRDVTCELSVNLMCTPQWGFSCDAR